MIIIIFQSLQNLSYLTCYLLKVWNDNQLKSLAEIIIKHDIFDVCNSKIVIMIPTTIIL